MSGLSVLLLDTEPRTQNYYITLAIADALRRHPDVVRVVLAHPGDALRLFVDHGLDTFVAFGGARTHAAVQARLARLARLSILWTTEDPYERASNVRFSEPFDLVFTNDKGSLDAYGGQAYHLPLAASLLFQDFTVLGSDEQYLYDVLFIGTAWPNRTRSLNRIAAAFQGELKLKLALPWNAFIGPPALDDPTLLTDWRCGNRDFARFANRSRIVLTLPRHFSAAADDQAVGTTPPPRLFEAALAGGAQVVVSPEPETETYYHPEAEIALCADDEAAVAAIRALLNDPARRIAMAEAARARSLAEHLYDHRVARMLALARERRTASTRQRMAVAAARRKTVLYVSHNRAGHKPGGGIEVYQEILNGLGPDYDVLFFFPVETSGAHGFRLEGRHLSRVFEGKAVERTALRDSAAESVFERVLVEHDVDLVHFHHLLGLPLSLPLIAKAYGVPTVWHLHDFYLICDRFNLLGPDKRFCDVVNRGSRQCDACLLATDGRPAGSKARRDNLTARIAASLDAVVASTAGGARYLKGFFPEIREDALRVIELPAPGPRLRLDGEPGEAAATLRVALPGNFTHQKGADDIVEVMRLCAGEDIRFHIFGRVEDYLKERLDDVDPAKVTLMEGYDQPTIVPLMSACDVSLHLSVWPETYMLSLTEAWQAGLVPIATRLGAQGERVTDGLDGFTVPPHDPGAALAALRRLYFDRDLLGRMRAAALAKTFPGKPAHVAAMAALYADLIAARPCPPEARARRKPDDFNLTLFDAGIRLNASYWDSRANLWDGQGESRRAPQPRPPRVEPREGWPDALAALAEEFPAPDDPALNLAIDTWVLDGQAADPRPAGVAMRRLLVRGWMVHERWPNGTAAWLRLRGPARTYAVPLGREEREHLAAPFGASRARYAGFAGEVDMEGLAPGRYAVDLVQVAGARLLVVVDRMAIVVEPAARLGHRVPNLWSAVPPDERARSGHAAANRATVLDHNGLRLAGSAVVPEGGLLWLRARLPAGPGQGGATARLEPLDGAGRAVSAPVHPAPDEDAVVVAARLSGVRPGSYRLVFQAPEGGGAPGFGTELRVFVPPSGRLFGLGDAPPPGADPDGAVEAGEGVVIEDAHRVSEAGEVAVVCVGWAFVPERGPVLATFARWTEDGAPRVSVSLPRRRPDLVAHFGTADAEASGFELGLTEAALRAVDLRLYQQYATGTLAFAGFAEALNDRLDPPA